jgi:chromate reductase, NAD(P)H dehydrogenase (quinone)
MITIIAGTNRNFSKTLIVSKAYNRILTEIGVENQVFSLADLPNDIAFTYLSKPKEEKFNALIEKYVRKADRLIFVIPEYQGTFPGIFKLFMDGIDPADLLEKKVALVGVSTGRSGNLRGLDHLTGALHYLNMHVFPMKIAVSKVHELVNKEFVLSDETTLRDLKKQAEAFVKY